MATTAVLGGITNTQAILGCAGMSAGDISDARLLASDIDEDLMLIMFDRLPEFEAYWQAGQDPAADAAAKRLSSAVSMCARWEGAAILASRWLGFKQLSSDGKVRNDRFDRMDLSKMQANIEAGRARAWNLLFGLLDPDARPVYAIPTFFGKVEPDTDPVVDVDD